MKKIFCALAAAALLVGCGGGAPKAEPALNLMKVEDFTATVDGKPVSLYTLTNGTITMQVTNFGCGLPTVMVIWGISCWVTISWNVM